MQKQDIRTYPRALSHIGLLVPDLAQAVAFYEEVMGWYTIMKPTVVMEDSEPAIGKMCVDAFGKG